MHPILKNILAVVLGWFSGSIINMGLVLTGHVVFPVDGLDPNNMEQLAEIMPTLTIEYFIFPFFGHALGTFVGAALAALIAANNKMKFAYAIGGVFFLGGAYMANEIGGPIWFTAIDLLVAYIPMAYIGGKLATR